MVGLFNSIGELVHEDKIILGAEESAEPKIKDHYSEKDGILASLPATKAVAARGTSLNWTEGPCIRTPRWILQIESESLTDWEVPLEQSRKYLLG